MSQNELSLLREFRGCIVPAARYNDEMDDHTTKSLSSAEICGEVTTATRYVANDMKTTDLICDKSRSLGNECKMEMAKTGALEFNVYAEENSTDSGDTPDKNGLKVTNVMAVWTENLPENTLTDVSLEVRPGGLVAVIGPVGSEKVCHFHDTGVSLAYH
ncbi:uncharacterized protein LOC110840679 [Zootermopsis nevadensis]|uniref:uncharacterized protein LOC110840679 n=1 Tax=Zootermopsis nevadensis TaxID=136037 RepID=UPI000B8E40F6|nr:uncharacterized protein LOC110840679 [Zootermopsis nevadensis]